MQSIHKKAFKMTLVTKKKEEQGVKYGDCSQNYTI
jgi:hypothetical protein